MKCLTKILVSREGRDALFVEKAGNPSIMMISVFPNDVLSHLLLKSCSSDYCLHMESELAWKGRGRLNWGI